MRAPLPKLEDFETASRGGPTMTTRRTLALAAALVALAAPAHAQAPAPARLAAPPRAFEGFLTRYRLDALRGGAIGVDGVGGRVMWSAPTVLGDPSRLAARTSVGLFGVFLPTQNGLGFSTLHAGGELAVRPLPRPIGGRVEPTLSAGVGALRIAIAERSRGRTIELPRSEGTNTVLAVSPGVGARVGLLPGLDVRGDVRDVLTFRGGTRHNPAFGFGLGMAF